MFARW
jgi:hypothetical protein